MVKVGDRVRYLNAVGGGIVVRIAKDIAYVDEDGFETPVLARECVVVEPAEPAKKAASVPASKVVTVPSVEKAYAPEEDDEDSFAVEYRLDTTKFYKLHTFRESLYFDEPSWTLDIVKNDMPVRPVVFDASDLERAMKMKKSADIPLRKPVVKHAEKTAIVEVDLHASVLLDTTAGLTSSEILDYQLGKVRETLDQYRHAKGRKIVFIHGKGEGVLRNALLKEIRDKYKNCSCQDASFREYGFGATMVTVH